MMELAFDIARGSSYKFNTAFLGEQASGQCKAVQRVASNVPVLVTIAVSTPIALVRAVVHGNCPRNVRD